MTPDTLRAIALCSSRIAEDWAPALTAAMESGEINTPARQAAFLATITVESMHFTRGRENLFYTSASRLLAIFGRQPNPRIKPDEVERFLRNPEALGNRVYANRNGNGDEATGDGYRYRGGGPIGLTFYNNWLAFERATGHQVVTRSEHLIETPHVGAASAAWFWVTNGCNALADAGNFQGVSAKVNTGSASTPPARINGYSERCTAWVLARKALGLA